MFTNPECAYIATFFTGFVLLTPAFIYDDNIQIYNYI